MRGKAKGNFNNSLKKKSQFVQNDQEFRDVVEFEVILLPDFMFGDHSIRTEKQHLQISKIPQTCESAVYKSTLASIIKTARHGEEFPVMSRSNPGIYKWGGECTAELIYCPEEQSSLLIRQSFQDFCSHSVKWCISQSQSLWCGKRFCILLPNGLRNWTRLINFLGRY